MKRSWVIVAKTPRIAKEVRHTTAKETDQQASATGTNNLEKQGPPQFIPKLKGKKVIIRLVSGGQPITGTMEGYNPYEILLQTTKGKLLVFKHAIGTIEPVDEPHSYRPSV